MKATRINFALLGLLVSGVVATAQENHEHEKIEVDLSKIPPAATREVDFVKDVKPLLERSCVKCHGGRRPKSKLNMETRETLLQGGKSEKPGLVVGNSEQSMIVQAMSFAIQDEDLQMPPEDMRDKFPVLSKNEIGLVRAWIDQGAKWPEGLKLEPAPQEEK